MDKVLMFFRNLIEATSVRDKVLNVIYLLIFIPIGIMMKKGWIAYPATFVEWITNFGNEVSLYPYYNWIFAAVQIANAGVLIGVFFCSDGFKNLMTRDNYSYSYRDEPVGWMMFANFVCFMLALSVNVFLFPMFMPIYFFCMLVGAYVYAKGK